MNKRVLLILLGSVIGLIVLFLIYRSVHAKPVAELRETLTSWQGGRDHMKSSLRDAESVRRQLLEVANTTLGADPEIAEHRLRTLLTDLCQKAGLAEFVITCREPKAIGNPAASEKPREFSREMRAQPDFIMQETTITGTGTYESCLRAIAYFEAQPWLARVEDVNIQPGDGDRKSFDLTARLVSLVMPDLADESTGTDAVVHEPNAGRIAQLSSRNPFIAKPKVAERPAPPPEPRPEPRKPPEPPYRDWVVSGVMQTPAGGEVIVSNQKTGASQSLGLGAEFLGLKIEGIRTGTLLVQKDGEGFKVALGQSLAERTRLIE